MAYGHDRFLGMTELLSADEVQRDRGGRFEAFAREQQPVLLQFLRWRTSEEDARDIAQESLARLLRYRDSEPAGAWKPLLYRIARNLLNEQSRRGYARPQRENVPAEIRSAHACTPGTHPHPVCPLLPETTNSPTPP